jgi:hypothetical protein
MGRTEVQVGFAIRNAVFVRVRDSQADQLISFAEDTPFVELTYEQPSATTRSNEIMREVDPVFGMGATNGNELFNKRRKKP